MARKQIVPDVNPHALLHVGDLIINLSSIMYAQKQGPNSIRLHFAANEGVDHHHPPFQGPVAVAIWEALLAISAKA